MTTTQQTALQLAARHLVEAQEQTARLGKILTVDGTRMFTDQFDPLSSTLNSLGRALEAAGATAPTEGYQGTPAPSPDSLEHLRRVEASRAEGRALLVFLQQALREAERLDKKRGNWVGDMADTEHGETPGTDYAESVQALLLRLQGELGAEGSGRE
jgi:hypothetical protein